MDVSSLFTNVPVLEAVNLAMDLVTRDNESRDTFSAEIGSFLSLPSHVSVLFSMDNFKTNGWVQHGLPFGAYNVSSLHGEN